MSRIKCSNCAEMIKAEAKVCHFCGAPVTQEHVATQMHEQEKIRKGLSAKVYRGIIVFVLLALTAFNLFYPLLQHCPPGDPDSLVFKGDWCFPRAEAGFVFGSEIKNEMFSALILPSMLLLAFIVLTFVSAIAVFIYSVNFNSKSQKSITPILESEKATRFWAIAAWFVLAIFVIEIFVVQVGNLGMIRPV